MLRKNSIFCAILHQIFKTKLMIDADLIKYLIGFFVVAIAAYEIAKFFQRKIHFPLITGLILTGILAGTSFLSFIPEHALPKLNFLNEIALAIIAFSAGAELHLEELRSRLNSIKWMTIGQLFITFIFSTLAVYFVADYIPFMSEMDTYVRLAIAMLIAAIFVARSPSSAIAIISEMRARGPFVKTAMGVTVVIDVLVIILFAIVFAVVKTIIVGEPLSLSFLLILLLEIAVSFILGYVFGKILKLLLKTQFHFNVKAAIIVIIGYSIYLLDHFVQIQAEHLGHHFQLEPLLIAIIASFFVTNYTKFNHEFEEIVSKISPYIYIIFFTLTGTSLSIQTLINVIEIALLLFLVRIITLILGGFFGVWAGKEPAKYHKIAWMPYVTQAGVAIGLTTMVSDAFPTWGNEFETIIIAIIVINQIVGPPLFKWAIKYIGEAHNKQEFDDEDKQHHAVIFSLDSISLALAKLLVKKKWEVKIITTQQDHNVKDVEVLTVVEYNRDNISKLDLGNPDSVVLLYPDDEKNYEIAEWIYESIGTPNMTARLESASFATKFEELGVKVIEPTAALINLLDHMVRAPEATNILLGLDDDQDTIDVEVNNQDMIGLRIRDLHLPQDLIILSLKRKGNTVITHGYTQLRLGDILTFVGSKDSLEEVRIRFEY
jgi:Trk K+ transport system NAD-binding subunit/Kef-type K+ transport system membrane component KefB